MVVNKITANAATCLSVRRNTKRPEADALVASELVYEDKVVGPIGGHIMQSVVLAIYIPFFCNAIPGCTVVKYCNEEPP